MTKSKVLTMTQLKASVKAAQKANAAKITEAALRASLEATLKLESSAELFKSKVALEVVSQHTKKLQELVSVCEGIITGTPITNNKTHTTRVWAGSQRFSFGNQINLMYQLATGIMYSCADHKQLLMAHTGLDSELIEQFVASFGTPAYYSRNNNILIESKMYDVAAVLGNISVMQSVLGVIVDTSQLTTANFSMEFGKAEITSQSDLLKAQEAIAEADLAL